MSVQEMQSLVNSFHYWDARVSYLNCNYFADEIELAYKDDKLNVIYKFLGCYKSIFDHVKNYNKFRPASEMTVSQVPYFLQNIIIGEITEQEITFYTCKINMFPLYLEIWFKDIKISSSRI